MVINTTENGEPRNTRTRRVKNISKEMEEENAALSRNGTQRIRRLREERGIRRGGERKERNPDEDAVSLAQITSKLNTE